MKNALVLCRLVQYLVSIFTTMAFLTQIAVVSGDDCDRSTFPVLISNDKGDTKIFAFDYNLGANRLVVAGHTHDKEIRKYDIT